MGQAFQKRKYPVQAGKSAIVPETSKAVMTEVITAVPETAAIEASEAAIITAITIITITTITAQGTETGAEMPSGSHLTRTKQFGMSSRNQK